MDRFKWDQIPLCLDLTKWRSPRGLCELYNTLGLTIFNVFLAEEALGLSLVIWPSGLGCESDTKTVPDQQGTTHVSTVHPALHRCMIIITSQGLPVPVWPRGPDSHCPPQARHHDTCWGFCYLLFSPAGLFEDKFGDVGSPGIGHVCGQVALLSGVLSPLTQQSGLSARRTEAASAPTLRTVSSAHGLGREETWETQQIPSRYLRYY